MTLIGDPASAAPSERQPASASRRSFAVGYDAVEVTSNGEADGMPTARLSWRERRRQRRIRRHRLVVVPVAVALLLVSAKLLGMSWWSRHGAAAYDDGDYATSRSEFSQLRTVNVVEPWKAWMAVGTAQFRLGDLGAAEESFTKALELNEERCDVRFNLAVTIEADGDRRMGGDVNEVEETEKIDGLARYRVALDLVNAGTCPPDGPGGPGTRLDETRERLEAKLGGEGSPSQQSATNDPDVDPEADSDPSDSATQQDQIDQRNQAGAAERQDSSDLDPSGQRPPSDPNW